jgi:hypothetical protein
MKKKLANIFRSEKNELVNRVTQSALPAARAASYCTIRLKQERRHPLVYLRNIKHGFSITQS